MKQFLGYIIKKAVGKGKVSPTIKSVKPNLKKTVKETKRDLETKNFLKIDKLRKQKSEGMKAARKAQKELQRAAETKRATKIGRSYFGRSVPARSSDLANPTEVKTKKFKTGKELEREKKMGGGMMGRRFGMKKGSKLQDVMKAAARDMQKTGRGKQFRKNTFVDPKTGRIVPDTKRNVKRYEAKNGSGKKFPDLTGDGKVTFADILKGRGVINGKKKKK